MPIEFTSSGQTEPGSGSGGWTEGRIPFADATGALTEDADLFFDIVANKLRIGTPLTNSMSVTTIDGVLEDLPDVASAGINPSALLSDVNARLASIMRNLSEINSKINAT